MKHLPAYWKTAVAFVLTVLGGLKAGPGLEHMTGDDWIDLAYLVVGTTFGVYVVPNERRPRPH